jgi:hypothetical protein
MTEPHQPDRSANDERPDQESTPPDQDQDTQPTSERPHADAQTEAGDTQAQGASIAQRKATKKGLLLGLGGGALVVIVVLALAAFVWPACLIGPGKPDDKAAEAATALASKNPAELEKVSCHGPDGRPIAQLPPQVLQLIQAAKQAGPPHLLLDTQARAPVDLTVGALGQSRDIPIDVVLGVTKGEWCMNGIADRQ